MRKIYLLFLPLLSTVVISCSSNDDDNFTPGPAAPEGNIGAYIVNDYSSQNVYEDQPLNDTLYFTVARTKDLNQPVSIPLVVDEADLSIINIPKTADFKAGESEMQLPVTFPNVELSKEYTLKFHLDDSYCNPYAKVDGSPSVSTTVLWSEWDVVCDTVRTMGSYVITKYQGSKLLNFRGQNRFRITNFLNSGIPFEFSVDGSFDKTNPANSYGKINPLSHAYDGGSYWAWGLSDWSSWTPVGMTKSIDAVYFYPSYGFDNIDFRIKTPGDYTIGDKTFTGETDFTDNYRNVELCGIGGAWEYLYFYFYYKK